MPDPSIFGLAVMPVIDDASPVEASNVLPVLPRFRPLWWLENRGLYSFDPKTYFATLFLPKKTIKHPRNHDKSIYGLKKP